MTPKEFVIKNLEDLANRFPEIRVRYAYDSMALVHTVEICPSDFYRSNQDYIAWENTMFEKFVDSFPQENICFVSEDAIVGVENAEYEKIGERFNSVLTENRMEVALSYGDLAFAYKTQNCQMEEGSKEETVISVKNEWITDQYLMAA